MGGWNHMGIIQIDLGTRMRYDDYEACGWIVAGCDECGSDETAVRKVM